VFPDAVNEVQQWYFSLVNGNYSLLSRLRYGEMDLPELRALLVNSSTATGGSGEGHQKEVPMESKVFSNFE